MKNKQTGGYNLIRIKTKKRIYELDLFKWIEKPRKTNAGSVIAMHFYYLTFYITKR